MFYVFDLLQLGDQDLRSEPLFRRKSLLHKLLRKNDALRYVYHIPTEGLQMFGGALALGMEGIVAKDKKASTSKDQTKPDLALAKKSKTNATNDKRRSSSGHASMRAGDCLRCCSCVVWRW